MISIGSVGSSGAAEYYARDNYYTIEEGAEHSRWLGQGAETLGLAGKVDPEAFERVLDGKLPNGSELTAARGEHRPGIDLTFSVSKSVSLVALLGGDQRVVEALRQSVAATLGWAEKNLAQARVWDGTRQVVENTGSLLAATFLHDVNRKGEPQLHVHAVIANATLASDGKWHALRNDNFYSWQHTIGAVHNADLRARLEALGYETVPARNPIDGSFEIKGISREAVEAFSTRSAEIEAALAKHGRSSPREREIATLATRNAKDQGLYPMQRKAEWDATAKAVGLDVRPIIDAARARSERGETAWSRTVEGIRGIGAKGLAIAAAMGLTARDRDELVPERKGALDPKAFAAAQAVASAVRELTEHEAGFDRLELLRTALERRGPLTAEMIEARIDRLQERGLLLGGERMLTPASMLALEKQAFAAIDVGRGAAPAVLERAEAAARVQEAARDLGLRRLNPGQQGAAIDILASRDRVHLVQGGAGTGKSAALAPVAAVARQEGRQIHAFGIAARMAREFGEKLGVEGKSVASLLARHARVLDGIASPGQIAAARAELGGSYIMVDEASMVGTEAFEKIIRLANLLEADRVVMAGDTRQLLAIAAGKPFEAAQERGTPTSLVSENLRAGSPQMKAVVAALEQRDVAGAFAALKERTITADGGRGAEVAAMLFASRTPGEREATLLLTAGRAMRTAANGAVQAELRNYGELGRERLELTVLDRVTITREGARQIKAYQDGRVVEFASNLKVQGIARGERGVVIGADERRVALRMEDGRTQMFEPHRLARNLAHDAVAVFEEKRIGLHERDRIRWTANDHERGLMNGMLARVEAIGKDGVTISTQHGELINLKHGDKMLEKLDLAYAVNVHVAQGMTAQDGILLMSERETRLNTTRSFLVAATRIAGEATLIVDNADRIKRGVTRNAGDKTSAHAIAGEMAVPSQNLGETPLDRLDRIASALGFDLSKNEQIREERQLQLERSLERYGLGRGDHDRDFDFSR